MATLRIGASRLAVAARDRAEHFVEPSALEAQLVDLPRFACQQFADRRKHRAVVARKGRDLLRAGHLRARNRRERFETAPDLFDARRVAEPQRDGAVPARPRLEPAW